MKPLPFYFIPLLMLTIPLAAQQQELIFRVEYQPGKTYISELKSISRVELTFEDDTITLENIRPELTMVPMVAEGSQHLRVTTTTGSRTDDGRIPMMVVFTEATMTQNVNGEETTFQSPIANAKIDGWVDDSGHIFIDSIYGNFSSEIRETISRLITGIRQQASFPSEPIKVGDVFLHESPLTIPIAGMTPMKILVKTTYKLSDVRASQAQFDVNQDVSLDLNTHQSNATAAGKGNGGLTFDLNNNFITAYNSEINMNLAMKLDNVKVKARSTTKVQQSVSIE